MHSVFSQSQPSYQHVMTDLWAKGTAASSRGFLKNANPHSVKLWWAFPRLVSMRTVPTVSQYGLIALSLTLSFFLLKQTCISFFFIIIRSIIFLWKTLHSNKLIYVVFPVMVRVRFVIWGVKGNTYTGQDRASTHHYGIIMTKGLYHSECCPHTCTAP